MTDNNLKLDSDANLSQRLDINFALQAAGLGVWELDPVTNTVIWDDQCRALFGLAKDNKLSYEQAIQFIHPHDVERVNQAVQWAIDLASGGQYDQTYRTIGADDGKLRWVRFFGRGYFNAEGQVYRFAGAAQEVTQQVQSRQQLEASEARFKNLVIATPAATAVYTGRDMLIQQVNAPMMNLWGKDASVIGKTLHVAMPELEGQPFLNQLKHVFDTGESFQQAESKADLIENDQLKTVWFNHAYSPLYDQDGQIYGVINTAVDVTAQVVARQQVEESEARLELLSESVPAMIFYLDEEQRYQSYNQTFMDWFGVGSREIINQSVQVFLGEQAYEKMASHLALAYTGQQERYEMLAPTRMGGSRWLSIIYTPHQNQTGHVVGVIVMATDVTQSKWAQEALRESEAALQSAIELAELGTWTVTIETGITELSTRHATMFGLDTTCLPYKQALAIVHPDDHGRVGNAFMAAMQPGSDGRYEAEYRIINAQTGKPQHIRARGITNYDLQGQPVSITGTTQDVTLERELQLVLETQIQQRTQELQLANQDLKRSNDNLQQFAYIASHDLQEPLRKIQSFGTLLEHQLDTQLDETSKIYLQRITSAGARMSTLIKDLLAFSRISTQQQAFGLVSLDAIVGEVLSTLDWIITERGAQVEVDELPVVKGDASQLSQLFQNLLTNAIKFTPAGEIPRIQIQCFQRNRGELPVEVRPTSQSHQFIQISVRDQGIGFDAKYLDRIFQVFQRLHGKNEYPGTGVGLAICQRVVENHGGAITADSKPNEGATFRVYLPA